MALSDLLNVTPYAFQKEGVRFILNHNYCILGDEMGLGKSLQAIAAALVAKEKTLIICPAYLRKTWAAEIEKLSKEDVCVAVFEKPEEVYFPFAEQFVIVSYNMLVHCEKLFDWADFVVADEVQYLKNFFALRSMISHKFIYEYAPKRFVGLSGTPIKNGVVEWYSLLTLCSYSPAKNNGLNVAKAFPDQTQWSRTFAYSRRINVGNGRVVEKYSGVRNKRKLREYLKGKYLRRLAKDELDLPKLISKDIIVNYGNDRRLEKAWDNHQSDKSVQSDAKARSALVKASFTARYCKDLHEGEGTPILIFTDHRKSAAKIAELLDCPKIDGGTPNKKRETLDKEFQCGEHPYLVATIGAAQTGYTWTITSNVVFNDVSWVPAHNMQAEKRIHRIGQNKHCTVHRIIGSRQDRAIMKILKEKEKDLEEAL